VRYAAELASIDGVVMAEEHGRDGKLKVLELGSPRAEIVEDGGTEFRPVSDCSVSQRPGRGRAAS
jgi:hypothetical protein